MDKTVPSAAAYLLTKISSIEAPKGYDTVYGNQMKKMPKPLTSMTIGEVIEQGPWRTKTFGSSACGAYQFMTATLKSLVEQLGLSLKQKFTSDLQDRLGYHLLKRRGYDAFMFGKIDIPEFGKRLAQEWASFPVLKQTKGQQRQVKRGESYYADDGQNKSLVKAETIENWLMETKQRQAQILAPVPTTSKAKVAIGAVSGSIGAAAALIPTTEGQQAATATVGALAQVSEAATQAQPVIETARQIGQLGLNPMIMGYAVVTVAVALAAYGVYHLIQKRRAVKATLDPTETDDVAIIDTPDK